MQHTNEGLTDLCKVNEAISVCLFQTLKCSTIQASAILDVNEIFESVFKITDLRSPPLCRDRTMQRLAFRDNAKFATESKHWSKQAVLQLLPSDASGGLSATVAKYLSLAGEYESDVGSRHSQALRDQFCPISQQGSDKISTSPENAIKGFAACFASQFPPSSFQEYK